ncbi:hypothetical protein C7293_21605 [filamentous cyanobacterium CCT1]|nr:hypothetical protein C7293_21605 [filamentous cyanobacterium CCT1]PSN80563.1 hypothetical protein C8B47_05915 [filamentous cyanobacterium CCP4]
MNGEGLSVSHPEIVEYADRLIVQSRMRVGMRVLLAVLGCFPLLAPYELLIEIEWEHYFNLFFLLAAIISAGATALSAVLFFAAVAGLSSAIVFDKPAATVSFTQEAPLVRRTTRVYPWSDIQSIELRSRDWSDGGPTYYLGISLTDGRVLESGSSWSQNEIERIKRRVDQFLAC